MELRLSGTKNDDLLLLQTILGIDLAACSQWCTSVRCLPTGVLVAYSVVAWCYSTVSIAGYWAFGNSVKVRCRCERTRIAARQEKYVRRPLLR